MSLLYIIHIYVLVCHCGNTFSLAHFLLASCLIYAWALLEYVIFILLLIAWVRSFGKMLPSMKFAEDKVLVLVILREKC